LSLLATAVLLLDTVPGGAVGALGAFASEGSEESGLQTKKFAQSLHRKNKQPVKHTEKINTSAISAIV
jgi:hypothetical protein